MSMSAFIAIVKIMFLIRTLCLGNESLYRRFLIIRLNTLRYNPDIVEKFVSPTLSCWKYVKMYNLEEVVLSFLDNGDSKRISCTKRLVKARVKEIEENRWRYSCMLYSDLNMYRVVVTDIKPLIWWLFVQAHPNLLKKASTVVSVLMNGQPKGLQCNFGSSLCKLCISRVRESPVHIILECDALQDVREPMSIAMCQYMPLAMRQCYIDMPKDEKIRFMLSGMSREFFDIMKCVASFIYAVYKKRKELYDELELM